jgi:hypothetical protein
VRRNDSLRVGGTIREAVREGSRTAAALPTCGVEKADGAMKYDRSASASALR